MIGEEEMVCIEVKILIEGSKEEMMDLEEEIMIERIEVEIKI